MWIIFSNEIKISKTNCFPNVRFLQASMSFVKDWYYYYAISFKYARASSLCSLKDPSFSFLFLLMCDFSSLFIWSAYVFFIPAEGKSNLMKSIFPHFRLIKKEYLPLSSYKNDSKIMFAVPRRFPLTPPLLIYFLPPLK